MSDERAKVVKAKLAMKDLGKAQTVREEKGENATLYLGRVVGVANRTKRGTNQQGQPFVGLVGTFQGIPADTSRPIVQAPVCYLPNYICEMVAAEIENAPEGELYQANVAVDVFSVKNETPIGFQYTVTSLIDTQAENPAQKLLASISNKPVAVPQIEGWKPEAQAEPATEPEAQSEPEPAKKRAAVK